MISLKNITKTYKVRTNKQETILNNLTVRFPNKGMVAILGKSGSGKTTLLNIIGGLTQPTSGDIEYGNINYKCFSQDEYNILRNDHIGFIFQDNYLIPELSVYENVKLALNIQNIDKNSEHQKIIDSLNKLEISDLHDKLINQLSGGEKQRVSIARVIAKGCKVVLADEPTGSLDEESADNVLKILKVLSKDILVILVTHNKEDAFLYSDRILNLQYGKFVEDKVNTNHINENEDYFYHKVVFEHHKGLSVTRLFNLSNKVLNRRLKRVIFTTIFWAFSLFLFLVCSTYLSVNRETLTLNTLEMNNINHIKLMNESFYNKTNIENNDNTTLSETEINEFSNLIFNDYYITNDNMFLLQDFSESKLTRNDDSIINTFYSLKNYYSINQFDYLSSFKIIEVIDHLPDNNRVKIYDDEVYLTDYLASKFIYYGLFNSDIDDIVGKKLKYRNGVELEIKGIIDTDYEKYLSSEYLTRDISGTPKFLNDQIYMLKAINEYSTIYLNKKTFDSLLEVPNSFNAKIDDNIVTVQKVDLNMSAHSYYGKVPEQINEIMVSPSFLSLFFEITPNFENEKDLYINKNISFTLEPIYGTNLTINQTYKIVGIYFNNYAGFLMRSDDYLIRANELNVSSKNNLIEGIAVSLSNSKTDAKFIKKIYNNNIYIYNYLMNDLITANSMIESTAKTTLYISIIFLCFLILIIYYFVSSLINANARFIGIMISLGTSVKDVIKIFLLEVMKTFTISFFISVLFNIFFNQYFNNNISKYFYSNLKILNFSILNIIVVFAIGLISVLISCFSPFHRLSKKEIINIIYNG